MKKIITILSLYFIGHCVSGQPALISFEYWFDTNYSERVFTMVNPANIYELDLNIEGSDMSTGLHAFHIRFKQSNGLWSCILTKLFFKPYINPNFVEPKIISYRYWIDQEFSNTITEELQPPVNPFNLIFELDLDTLQTGLHYINTQFLDINGLWSSVLTQPFYRGEITTFSFKVFLEGPYISGMMNAGLNPDIIPLNQPYDQLPFSYPGTENVTSIPDPNIVDWILIELRDTIEAFLATEETRIARHAAFMRNDGTIVGLDGNEDIKLYVNINDSIFAVILHRNHLGIMSSASLIESNGKYSYDFTTSSSQAYNEGQKALGGEVYGMYAGDANADGSIDGSDKILWETIAGTTGYLPEDFNMDGQVMNQDKGDYWLPNIGAGTQVPE